MKNKKSAVLAKKQKIKKNTVKARKTVANTKKKCKKTNEKQSIALQTQNIIKKGNIDDVILFFNQNQQEICNNCTETLVLLENYYNEQVEINKTVKDILAHLIDVRKRKLPKVGLFAIKIEL